MNLLSSTEEKDYVCKLKWKMMFFILIKS